MPIVDKALCACDCHARGMEVCRECCVRTAKDHAFETMMKQNQTALDLQAKVTALELQNQELQHEIARLTRNEKCYGCGHSHENHDPIGCLVWVEADADRKCLCKKWIATERRS